MRRHPFATVRSRLGLGLAAAMLLAGCQVDDSPAGSASGRSFGAISFDSCSLDGGSNLPSVQAQCGRFEVAENPDDPGSRTIALNIAWLPATEGAATDDPVFFLAGGPGQAATRLAGHLDIALAEVRKQRDIILIDQRGTGDSNPLTCLDADGAVMELEADTILSAEAVHAYARSCLASLAGRADPRFYTTGHAIADLDAVRAALGVDQVNLVGGSYGTRVAQQYTDAYPAHVRTMVIDGVAPNDLVVGGEFDRTFERALALQSARCADDAQCSARFPTDLRTQVAQVIAQLRDSPVEVDYRDPRTGTLERDTATADTVTGLVFFFSYAPETVALLPLLFDEAANGRYASLMSLYQMANRQAGDLLNRQMHWSVLCAEDAGRHQPDDTAEERILGPDTAQLLFGVCDVWPTGTPRDGHTRPLQSDVPTLLLSGALDPVTPPEYAERVLAGLPNGRHLVLEGQSHGTLVAGCMPKLLAQFVESADAAGLDAQCLDDAMPLPAFTSFNGWSP